MADTDRELRIMLKLLADTAGATQVRAQLTALQREQENLGKQTNSLATAELSTTQATAAAQQTLNTIMERRVIMETQLEAAEARIAGNTTLAARLEREAVIRTQALTVQRAMNVSTEESIVLAERLIVAHEASVAPSALMGVNLARAKQEALVLGRELASGTVRASTLSSLLGSLGSTLTIAGIGAYELYHLISSQVDQTRELTKEYEKIVEELNKASAEWDVLADRAEVFGDHVKIAEKIKQDLDRMGKDMEAFRTKELPLWQRFWDDLVSSKGSGIFSQIFQQAFPLTAPDAGSHPFAEERRAKVQREQNRELEKANDELNKAQQAEEAWARAQTDVGQGLADYSAKLSEAETRLNELDAARRADPTNRAALDAFVAQTGVVNDLRGKVEQLGDAWDKVNKVEDRSSHRDQMQLINALLREQTTQLERIRQQQQLIEANPFLGADQKQALTLAAMVAQVALLGEAIAQTKRVIADSALDPVMHERLQAQLQKDQFEFDLLHLKIAQINKPLSADLADWVNNFGTAAHQIANLIEGSINAALQGTNQLLLDAVFQTGDWRQTLMGVERQILNLFLTWIEQMALQQAAELLGITTKTGAQSAANVTTLATAGPAAVAQTGASSGTNWIIGAVAAAAAIAAIVAAMSGAFARGGRTGRGPKFATVGEEGEEFVFNARATRNIGVDNLYAMMHAAEAAPHFVDGGRVRYPGLFPGNDIEPPWLPGADLPNDFFDPDVPVAPRLVALDPYGLPIGPGIDENAPSLFPSTGGPTVDVNWRGTGGAPYWNMPATGGGPSPMPWWVTFNPNIGQHPTDFGGTPNIYVGGPNQPNTPTYNTSTRTWQYFDPAGNLINFDAPPPIGFGGAPAVNPTSIIPDPTRSGVFIDPATGMTFTRRRDGSYVPVSPGTGGGPVAAPIGTHWDFTRGTYVQNDFAGGPQFNSRAAALLEMWEQSIAGKPNTLTHGNTDFGHNVYTAGTFHRLTDADMWDAAIGSAWHGADGLRLPGAPSRTDTMLGWLAAGERVIPAERNVLLEKTFGFDWDKRLEVAMPHFATGGRLGPSSSSSSARGSADQPIVVNVHYYNDERKARRAYEDDPNARKVFRRNLNRYS